MRRLIAIHKNPMDLYSVKIKRSSMQRLSSLLRPLLLLSLALSFVKAKGQDTTGPQWGGSAKFVNNLNRSAPLTIGMYGEAHFNRPMGDRRYNGQLDVHRLVPFIGYNFSDKTSLFTEIEIEHVEEIYVEQAFLEHRLGRAINFRGGLLLVPMGIINEYHEPTTFNSVERPMMDHDIVPTTWRELGAGFSGNIRSLSLNYQIYALNGFKSYAGGKGTLGGADGLRGGRQKGASSFASYPNVSGKVEYYGIKGLKVGLSGYYGKTQSSYYNGLEKDEKNLSRADSTVVGVAMVGADFRYQHGGFRARGQYILSKHQNTAAYNEFTGQNLGSSMYGYYVGAGYDLMQLSDKTASRELLLFGRYSDFDTHAAVENGERNKAFHRKSITFGVNYDLADGAVLKLDYQMIQSEGEENPPDMLNAGIGFWFY